MYKRDILAKCGKKSVKTEKNRIRNVIMNFRTTQDEREKINRRIELSGLSKQDFFIQSLMNQKVNCIGNIKTFDVMKKRLYEIEVYLQNVDMEKQYDDKIVESLRMILELFNGLNKLD